MAESPHYYCRGSIQVWDFIRDQELNYHLGNAIKYICRAGHKDSKVTDLEKAIHYLTNELDNELQRTYTKPELVRPSYTVSPFLQRERERFPEWEDDPESFDR